MQVLRKKRSMRVVTPRLFAQKDAPKTPENAAGTTLRQA